MNNDDICSQSLQNIYSKQVAGKKSINTMGLTGGTMPPVITKDPLTKKLEDNLSNTLQKLFPSEDKKIDLTPQTKEQEALDNIKKALEELKNLNAI